MESLPHEIMHMDDYDIVNDTIDTIMEIFSEIDGAKKYINSALMMKSHDRQVADNNVALSLQELQHADILTGNVNRMMDKMLESKHPCYDVLHKVWTHMHSRQADYISWVKTMHDHYKH